MKYEIKIMGKHECTKFSTKDLDEDCIIISINDTNHNTVIYDNEKIKGVLRLWFDDIDKPIKGCNMMCVIDSEAIVSFVNTYKDKVNNILIHCTAGISRSAAVGCSIARYLNGDDTYLWSSGRYMPNKHVYKLMCEALGLEYSDELFKEKSKIKTRGDRVKIKAYLDYGQTLDDIFCDVIINNNIKKN